jgi:hypothetical protein
LSLSKLLERNNIKGGGIFFGSQFQGFHWLHYFKPEVRMNIMVTGVCGQGGLLTLLATRKYKGVTERKRQETTLTRVHLLKFPYPLNNSIKL